MSEKLPLAYRIKYFFWPDGRWKELSAIRRLTVVFWGLVFDHVWRIWLRPHVFPRRWERERRHFHEHMRVPEHVNAFLIEDDGAVVVHLIERNGPWTICCLQADDIESAKKETMEQLHYWKDEAGSWSREGRLTVEWHERAPTPEDKAFTR